METKNNFCRLNLGCGDVFHSDWINLDVLDYGGRVLRYNLNLGIPFADESFDIVYHSHILEHFPHKRAKYFLSECFRVLKAGAILRLAIPDLEAIARNYVKALDDIEKGVEGAQARRRWMTIEMYDQVVREKSGGEMTEFLMQNPVPEQDFVISRMGKTFLQPIEFYKQHPELCVQPPLKSLPQIDFKFKKSGELHQWMYDFYALQEMLSEIGFIDIKRQAYNTSDCEDYLKYHFDTDSSDGSIRKPDSLFVEARKPMKEVAEKPLRVAMFAALDYGGAANAAVRQHNALRKIGINCEMYTGIQKKIHTGIHIVPSKDGFVEEGDDGMAYQNNFALLRRNWNNESRNYPNANVEEFCYIHTDSFNPNNIPLFNEFDIINLEWVIGFADPAVHPEYYMGKPIVWTLHDMNALTGGCHYSCGCEKFSEKCGSCPHLGSIDDGDISARIFAERLAGYQNLDLHIVTPSEWLAEQVKKSRLLNKFPVSVIRYATPLGTYKPLADREKTRLGSGIKSSDTVLLFSADLIRSERKGCLYLLSLLQNLAKTELAKDLVILIMGSETPVEFTKTGLRTHLLGYVDDENTAAIVYNIADAMLIPSLEDNAPNTISESLGCGTPVIGFKSGGIPEMIQHGKTGWLADKGNVEQLVLGVRWLALNHTNPQMRHFCREFAEQNFDEVTQANKYKKLYQDILARR